MKKQYILPAFLFVLALVAIFVACKKVTAINEPAPAVAPQQVVVAPPPSRLNYSCTHSPDYGDSIIYLQPTNKNDYIVMPVNRDSLGSGKFISWPQGLMLDSASGAIDVTQSETGLRYLVGFVRQGSTDTCVSNLIVAGITYIDSIHVLSNNDTLAIPYFNANTSVPSVCDPSDDSDYPGNSGNGNGDNKCVFDGADKKGKKGQANGKNVKVRTISGIINLKATLFAGAFGSNPVNGASITVPIFYSLNDKSKKSLQVINVQLMYFNHLSDIPAALVNDISMKRNEFLNNIAMMSFNPRPPLIIIVR